MIDTVKLRSPWVPCDGLENVFCELSKYTQTDMRTGLREYELVRGGLLGTFDHRVSVRFEETRYPVIEWEFDNVLAAGVRMVRIVVEGSVHKRLLGHNVGVGPTDVAVSLRWFVRSVCGQLGAWCAGLADQADAWEVMRIDWAEVFDLGCKADAVHWLRSANIAHYARRKRTEHAYSTGCMYAGTTSTLKMYHKGTEFDLHDGARLRKSVDGCTIEVLRELANRLVRVEVEVKGKKLRDLAGGRVCTVGDIRREWLEGVYDMDVLRLLNVVEGPLGVVNERTAVVGRLVDRYGRRRGRAVFATWLQICALGEVAAKGVCSHSTWYRHLQELRAAGVSFVGSDIAVDTTAVQSCAAGFRPSRSDSRRLWEVDCEVVAALAA